MPLGDGQFQINLNESLDVNRARFTLAHELGHLVYHRDKIGDGLDDSRAYRSSNIGRYHNRAIGVREETEANQFAAWLLMPDFIIKSMLEHELTHAEMAKRLGVSSRTIELRVTAFKALRV